MTLTIHFFGNTYIRLFSFCFRVPISKDVPCGCAFFEHEFFYAPSSFLKDKFTNLFHVTTYKSVGHFGALERNSVLAEDIVMFVKKVEDQREKN